MTRSKNIHRMEAYQTFDDLNEESKRVDVASEKVFKALRDRGDVAWFLLPKLYNWVVGPWSDGGDRLDGLDGGEGSDRSIREKPRGVRDSRREIAIVKCDGGRGGDGPTTWDWEIYNPRGGLVAEGIADSMEEAQDAVDVDLRARGYILP